MEKIYISQLVCYNPSFSLVVLRSASSPAFSFFLQVFILNFMLFRNFRKALTDSRGPGSFAVV